jgi:hypothetical protein
VGVGFTYSESVFEVKVVTVAKHRTFQLVGHLLLAIILLSRPMHSLVSILHSLIKDNLHLAALRKGVVVLGHAGALSQLSLPPEYVLLLPIGHLLPRCHLLVTLGSWLVPLSLHDSWRALLESRLPLQLVLRLLLPIDKLLHFASHIVHVEDV